MGTRKRNVNKRYAIWAGSLLALALACMGGSSAVDYIQARRAMKIAELYIQKGLSTLAADTLEPYRRQLVEPGRGCSILVASYFNSRNPGRLQWASEACLNAGRDTPDIYVSLAAASEMVGRDPEALQILMSAAKRFETSPDIYYRLASIFRRQKNEPSAVAAYMEAAKRAGNNNHEIVVEALEYFSNLKKWEEARQMADLLRNAQTDNPAIKLLLARAYMNAGDRDSKEATLAQAKDLLSRRPASEQAQYVSAFKDLLPQAETAKTAKKTPDTDQ